MFRQLAAKLQTLSAPVTLFDLHPVQLARLMEDAWTERGAQNVGPSAANAPNPNFEYRLPPDTVAALSWPLALRSELNANVPTSWSQPLTWDHAIYAYLVETTGIYEIMRRVIAEYAHGETLGAPTPRTRRWLRATEELFYSPWQHYGIGSVTSEIRPDSRAIRLNLFWRLFGVELQRLGTDGRPYPYEKSQASNQQFVSVLEEWLREIWRGIENSGNTSGANPTDDNVLVSLARSLTNMLTSRRISGNLAREEYLAVSSASWMSHAIEWDSPLVVDLRCQATSASERLRLIGERVGVPAYARSDSCLQLAVPMSEVMIRLEANDYGSEAGAQTLYLAETAPNTPNRLRSTMTTIITQWSQVTGRPMKAPKVQVMSDQAGMRTVAQAAAPVPVPTNGNRPVGVG